MLPASLPIGVDGADAVPDAVFLIGTVVEMTAADFVLVGRGGNFLLFSFFCEDRLKGERDRERDLERDRDRRAFSRRLEEPVDLKLVSLLDLLASSFFDSSAGGWTLSSSGIWERSVFSPSTS